MLAEGEVYSQPAATGVGVHESTQLVAAVDALKVRYRLTQRHGNPVRLEDFALMHGLNGLLDSKSGLFQRFVQHPKVEYNAKTDLYSYKVRGAAHPARLQCAQQCGPGCAVTRKVLPPFGAEPPVGGGGYACGRAQGVVSPGARGRRRACQRPAG